MTLNDFYDYAFSRSIAVCCNSLPNKKAFSVKVGKDYYIAMDYRKIKTEREERLILAEELGHCEKCAMYQLNDRNRAAWDIIVSAAETKAKNWMVQKLVPCDKLKKLIMERNQRYEIAEILDVPEQCVEYAINYYKSWNMI